MSKLFLSLTLPFFLICHAAGSPADSASTSQPKAKKEKVSCLKRLSQLGLVALMGHIFIPAVYHNVHAHMKGQEHLAFGIYLDMNEVKNELNPEQKKWLSDPKAHQVELASFFSEELNGDYNWDEPNGTGFFTYAHERDAITFFKGHSTNRGVCRDKALILTHILLNLGIKAQMLSGDGHSWVRLPDVNLYADPTNLDIFQDLVRPGTNLFAATVYDSLLAKMKINPANAKDTTNINFLAKGRGL